MKLKQNKHNLQYARRLNKLKRGVKNPIKKTEIEQTFLSNLPNIDELDMQEILIFDKNLETNNQPY